MRHGVHPRFRLADMPWHVLTKMSVLFGGCMGEGK